MPLKGRAPSAPPDRRGRAGGKAPHGIDVSEVAKAKASPRPAKGADRRAPPPRVVTDSPVARSAGPAPVLVARNVELRREGKRVLERLCWEVLPGERWTILGPNGCGKTSLSLAIQGRLFPWKGTLEVLGIRYGRDPLFDLWARVGFAGEALDPLVEPRTTILELVASAHSGCLGVNYARPDRESRCAAREELAFWGIESIKARPYHRVSQGQRRRCQIARALAADPDLLVLDEPFAGLDPAATEELIERLEALARERPKIAILLVTHRIDEIPRGFDRTLLLRDGRIFGCGPSGETLTDRKISTTFSRPFRIHRIDGRSFLIPSR